MQVNPTSINQTSFEYSTADDKKKEERIENTEVPIPTAATQSQQSTETRVVLPQKDSLVRLPDGILHKISCYLKNPSSYFSASKSFNSEVRDAYYKQDS